jgi:hypothetical protein
MMPPAFHATFDVWSEAASATAERSPVKASSAKTMMRGPAGMP